MLTLISDHLIMFSLLVFFWAMTRGPYRKTSKLFGTKNPPRHFSQFKANNEMKNMSGNS